jgi:hypothetical protein
MHENLIQDNQWTEEDSTQAISECNSEALRHPEGKKREHMPDHSAPVSP